MGKIPSSERWRSVAYIISGWNLKFMVDITMVYGRYSELVFMGVLLWFINQRSHHWGAPSKYGIVWIYPSSVLVTATPPERCRDSFVVFPGCGKAEVLHHISRFPTFSMFRHLFWDCAIAYLKKKT